MAGFTHSLIQVKISDRLDFLPDENESGAVNAGMSNIKLA